MSPKEEDTSAQEAAGDCEDRATSSPAARPNVQPQRVLELSPCYTSTRLGLRCLCSLVRAPEAFVSIQLEKVGLRDMMLNAFLLRKQTMADSMNLDEIEKTKREVIVEYCQKFNQHMSHYALRGQIMAYCNSLRALLEDFPTIRDTVFMVGQPQERRGGGIPRRAARMTSVQKAKERINTLRMSTCGGGKERVEVDEGIEGINGDGKNLSYILNK
ncbi:hypothetical protein QTO34_001239 [Cnephaeus nilssonii]|uniref:Uncharacterized protein n=1 Tax=Cnephaeus nilssonii TaxID=3371016 RepID=A0AA40LNP8_CNENI|nr:hypothetical protein QTO34_001239 [Eptesicus nilssonii]